MDVGFVGLDALPHETCFSKGTAVGMDCWAHRVGCFVAAVVVLSSSSAGACMPHGWNRSTQLLVFIYMYGSDP